MTHICVCNLTIIGSDNGLSPGQHQAIIWTNAGILLIGPLGTNLSEISIQMQIFSFKKCIWKCCLRNGSHFVSASMCYLCIFTYFIKGDIWSDMVHHAHFYGPPMTLVYFLLLCHQIIIRGCLTSNCPWRLCKFMPPNAMYNLNFFLSREIWLVKSKLNSRAYFF